MQNINRQKGFTLTFAILVGALLLSIGISMANLALKELALSSIGKESRSAFYAADSGIECAIFWDVHGRYIDPDWYISGQPINDDYEAGSPRPETRFFFDSEETHPPSNTKIQCGDKLAIDGTPVNLPNITVAFESFPSFDSDGNYYKSTFRVDYNDNSCALVEVRKYYNAFDDYDAVTLNRIISNGINDCTETNNPYRVQRTLRLTYQ